MSHENDAQRSGSEPPASGSRDRPLKSQIDVLIGQMKDIQFGLELLRKSVSLQAEEGGGGNRLPEGGFLVDEAMLARLKRNG